MRSEQGDSSVEKNTVMTSVERTCPACGHNMLWISVRQYMENNSRGGHLHTVIIVVMLRKKMLAALSLIPCEKLSSLNRESGH